MTYFGQLLHVMGLLQDGNFDPVLLMRLLGVLTLASPALLMAGLGLLVLFGARLSERFTTRLTMAAISFALLASIGMMGLMLALDNLHFTVKLADWVAIPGYHFVFKLVFDRLSVAFVILTLAISGVIGSFSTRYMHKDPGFTRYFVLYAMFVLGMVLASLSDTIETLFAGWELVGLSSALLVGFFQERPAPSRNGLWVWIVYRVADAALLLAAIVLHHMKGEGDFDKLMGAGPWPKGDYAIPATEALLVGLLLLVAAARQVGPGAVLRLGCRAPWRGRPPAARSTTGRCRSTSGHSCCCAWDRSSKPRSRWRSSLSSWAC